MAETLFVQRLADTAVLPATGRSGDAGLDLCSIQDAHLAPGGGRAVVGTGLAIAIPAGCVGLVSPRSGLAADHGVTIVNSPGVIDSGYRGEIMVILVNTDSHVPYDVRKGDRIAQLIVMPLASLEVAQAASLPSSERGERGLGSTGR